MSPQNNLQSHLLVTKFISQEVRRASFMRSFESPPPGLSLRKPEKPQAGPISYWLVYFFIGFHAYTCACAHFSGFCSFIGLSDFSLQKGMRVLLFRFIFVGVPDFFFRECPWVALFPISGIFRRIVEIIL